MNTWNRNTATSFSRFRPYFNLLKTVKFHYAGALIFGLICGLAGGFGFPFLAYKIFPLVFADTAPDPWLLAGAVMLLPVAFTIRGVSGFANAYLTAYCGVRVLIAIKTMLYAKVQQLPVSFFARNKAGDLMTRVLADAASVQNVVTVVLNDLIKQPVTFLGAMGALIYMAFQNDKFIFVLFALSVIPLCVLPIKLIGRKILARSRQLQKSAGSINSMLHENLAAVREIRAFNLQEREAGRFAALLETVAVYILKTIKYHHMLTPVIEVIAAVGISVAIFYASRSRMGLEDVLPLMTALYMTYEPLKKMGSIQGMIKKGQASVDRIEYILHAEDDLLESSDPVPFVPAPVEISLENVEFGYDENRVLHNITATISSGTVTALVGPSGAGKSTFINLLPRFYDVNTGAIKMGGVDIRQFSKHDLRAHISIVSQDTLLFNDTLRNNIRLGRLDATDVMVENAAQLAHAHEFIMGFEEGYETMAGERGLRLSGGQKQRIALARAFLKNAPILIMDEATSSLDADSEAVLQSALEKLIQGKTVLIIAHRFSTIKFASRIILLDQGRLRASGTHESLYASDALYKSLYDKQFITR